MNYNIYVGVPSYQSEYVGTLRNVTEDEAMDYAYEEAYEQYDTIAGLHGIPSWNDCQQEIEEQYADEIESGEYSEEDIEQMTNEQFEEEFESWSSYYVKEESSDTEFSETKFYLN